MQQLLQFTIKYRYLLLVIILESIALFLTIETHSFHKSKVINSANAISGGFYKKINTFNNIFSLKQENQRLINENTELRNLLSNVFNDFGFASNKSPEYKIGYIYMSAKIISNQYSKQHNYLTIDKGSKDGIARDMGVFNDTGVIGIVTEVSNHYALVRSILNRDSKINAKLKKNNHFGTLIWNGDSYRYVQLIDIPREAEIKLGDTIVSGNKSLIFPANINIGKVSNIYYSSNSYTSIDIMLFNDMTSLNQINIVNHVDKNEIKTLEAKIPNE